MGDSGSITVIGAGLSPNGIGLTNGTLISLDRMPEVFELDKEQGLVRVNAHMRLSDLCSLLAGQGQSLPTLGSIVEQTVGGVISTATHGSSLAVGSFSSLVRGLEIVLADGRIMDVSLDHPDFDAFSCSVGSLGVITHATLAVEPLFAVDVVKHVHDFHQVRSLLRSAGSYHHYKLWYLPQTDQIVEWMGTKRQPPPELGGGRPPRVNSMYSFLYECFLAATLTSPGLNTMGERIHQRFLHPLTRGLEKAELLPYIEALTLDCLYSQHVTEFAFDLGEVENFLVALRDELRKPGFLVHAPVEIRFGPPETSWLSPAYGRTTCWVGWVRYRPFNLEAPEDGLFSKLREIARSFGGREHWAKVPGRDASQVERCYPMHCEFEQVRAKYDPTGKLTNFANQVKAYA